MSFIDRHQQNFNLSACPERALLFLTRAAQPGSSPGIILKTNYKNIGDCLHLGCCQRGQESHATSIVIDCILDLCITSAMLAPRVRKRGMAA